MNFPRGNNFSGFLSRIVPSKISAKLGFERKKEKDEEEGLEESTTSQPEEESSSSGAGSVAVGDELSTAVQRGGRKEKVEDEEHRFGEDPQHPRASSSVSMFAVATEVLPAVKLEAKRESIESSGSSSDSSSIEEALRKAIGSKDLDEFADAFANRSKPRESKKVKPEEVSNQENPEVQQQEQEKEEERVELFVGEEAADEVEEGEFELQNLQNPAASPPPDHVNIDLQDGAEEESVPDENPTYVESYLGLMYKFGLSPFLPEGASPGIWGYCQIACFVQVALYWIFTFISILDSLAVAKFSCIQFVTFKGDLEDFTNMCYYIVEVCVNIYSGYLFSMQQQKFAKMLKSLSRLRAFADRYSKVKEDKSHTFLVYILAATSLVMSTLNVVFASGFVGWTLENSVLLYTFEASTGVFVWTEEGYNSNSTGISALFKQYAKNPTTGKVIVGMIYGAMRLCNYIMTNVNSDLILTTGATIKSQMVRLAKEVGNPENDINPVTMENFEAPGGQWEHYQLLEDAVEDTNETFDCLLKYLHVQNVMLFVYLVMNAFDDETKLITVLYLVYNIIKASCTYRIATQASQKNQTFRNWIRRLIWKSPDPEFRSKANTIIDKMKEQPLGLGQGQFMIDESFLFRFLGTVGSVFVLQTQAREASRTARR